MNGRAVLTHWEAAHASLTEAQRGAFLARSEVRELASMPEEVVRAAIRAHPKLREELLHARWLGTQRQGRSSCGCSADQDDAVTGRHRLVLLPGPDGRAGFSGPKTTTVVARCSCGWEKRAGSEALLRSLWHRHAAGDDADLGPS